ncbi:MAG: hypothetical protein HYS40_00125, partial [Gemmatimonadetes bacterium]|nr:hypothetical protein [Gemmatimonadota bacterium]
MTPLLLALLAASPWPPRSQVSPCQALADSVVAAVDSVPDRAVLLARRLRRECRHTFEPLFAAGRAINQVSGFEYNVARDNQGMLLREEAQRLLDRAVQLRPSDAAAWFEYGIALKKRGGLQIDAFRAIRKALALADEVPDSTLPPLLAGIHFQRARYLQDW